MNNFSNQVRLFSPIGTTPTIIRSKHWYNDEPSFQISFDEFNTNRSLLFRFAIARFAYNSILNLVKKALSYPNYEILRPESVYCFIFSDVEHIWNSFEESRDYDYIEELYNFSCYLNGFINAHNGAVEYQDEYSHEFNFNNSVPIMNIEYSSSRVRMEPFDEDVTYYYDSIETIFSQYNHPDLRFSISDTIEESDEDSDSDYESGSDSDHGSMNDFVVEDTDDEGGW